jgi:hypothetical protein
MARYSLYVAKSVVHENTAIKKNIGHVKTKNEIYIKLVTTHFWIILPIYFIIKFQYFIPVFKERWDVHLFPFMPRMRLKKMKVAACFFFNFNCQSEIVRQNRHIITGVKSLNYIVFLFKKM